VTVRDEKVNGSWSAPARADVSIDLHGLRSRRPSVRLRGRNLSKADILVYRLDRLDVAIKDYGRRPWPVRATLGRWLVRREAAAYRALEGVRGVPRFLGRVGPWALATAWIDARTLPELAPERAGREIGERVAAVVEGIHRRGVALADLHHRDCLIDPAGEVWLVDFATAFVRGPRPGPLRRWVFERLRQADLVAVARIRARFSGEDEDGASRTVGRGADRWHRRGRTLKRAWNAVRGREG
jgi:hypothetical protein